MNIPSNLNLHHFSIVESRVGFQDIWGQVTVDMSSLVREHEISYQDDLKPSHLLCKLPPLSVGQLRENLNRSYLIYSSYKYVNYNEPSNIGILNSVDTIKGNFSRVMPAPTRSTLAPSFAEASSNQ